MYIVLVVVIEIVREHDSHRTLKRKQRRGGKREGRAEGSKNIVYCSKWAVTRSCVTTSSIAHKGSSTEKAEERQRKNDVRFL